MDSPFRFDLVSALQSKGKLLSPSQTKGRASVPFSGIWPLLTFFLAQSLSETGDETVLKHVALAVECAVCALDLNDDVIDDEKSHGGRARTALASLSLLQLASRSITSLLSAEGGRKAVPASRVQSFLYALEDGIQATLFGQYEDVQAEQRDVAYCTHDECIALASAKGGSVMRMTCLFALLSAEREDDAVVRPLILEFGECFGTFLQLDNDSHDFEQSIFGLRPLMHTTVPARPSPKTDVQRAKKTLPLILSVENGVSLQQLQEAPETLTEEQMHIVRGAIAATWSVGRLFRERALTLLTRSPSYVHLSPSLWYLLHE